VSAGLLVLFLSAGAWERARVWKDEGTLWRDAAARSERSALARFNLGTWWLERGRADLAEGHLRAALEADPTMTRPYHNLGVIYYGQGKFPLAATFFEGGLRLSPENYDLWMGLGAARAGAGERDPAAAAFREAARLRPQAGAPLLAQGLLLAEGGEAAAARKALRTFLASGEGDAGQRHLARERIRNLER
jgi:Tfp pilus assembly protein PilF